MKQKKKHRPTDETLSWKELLRLYRKIRIPWGMLILVGGFSLLIKQAQLWLVPYTSKIMTGAITEHGFIAGFVGFTLLYTLVEALQGGINELTGQITQRNVRHTVWNRILRLPMSYFGDQDRQGLVSRVTQDTTGTYGVHRAFTEEELVDAAKKAKAYNFIQEKENGFDTQISRFDNKYSGGEMQRIAIARMILKRPEILIMDEATSGIDVISEHEVMEALMNLMAGKTVIMVSHDMEMIRRADNLIVLNGGQVEASGDFHQVAAASPLFQAFLDKGGYLV